MTLTSIPSALSRGAGLPGWIVGALVVAAGTGGIKSNVSPLVADQYRHTKLRVETRKNGEHPFPSLSSLPSSSPIRIPSVSISNRTLPGERVIVDPNLTISRIYNLFYWCINVGSLSAIATTESERQVGFWLAFTIPTAVFVITPIVLIVSRNWYYKVPPKGSIVVDTWRCAKVALGESGWWRNPGKVGKEEGGLWKYAKPSYYAGSGEEGSMKVTPKSQKRFGLITWDDVFVDEVKRTLRACQIFVFYPVRSLSFLRSFVRYAHLTTLSPALLDLL